jgi:hypothetical protein
VVDGSNCALRRKHCARWRCEVDVRRVKRRAASERPGRSATLLQQAPRAVATGLGVLSGYLGRVSDVLADDRHGERELPGDELLHVEERAVSRRDAAPRRRG